MIYPNAGSGEAYAVINNFTLKYDYALYSNMLPVANISPIDPNTCIDLNESYKTLTIPISLTSYDVEGDQIYYSYQNMHIKTDFYYVKYQKSVCVLGICDYFPDNTFLERIQTRNQTDCLFYNISDQNLIPDNNNRNYVVYDAISDTYVFRMSDQCIGNKNFNYVFKKPIENVFYDSTILDLSNNEDFNFTLYTAGYLNKTTELRFKKVNSKTEIYDYEGTLLLNLSLPNDFEFSIHEYSNNTNLLAISNIANGIALYNKTMWNASSYIATISWSGLIFQKDFYYTGTTNTLNWTTDNTFNFTIDSPGYYCNRFKVTDTPHLNIDYRQYETCIVISKCGSIFGNMTGNMTNPVTGIKTILNDGIKDYLDSLGLYEQGKTLMWWIWIFLFLGIMMSEYMVLRRIDLTFALIGSSFLCLICSWIAGYTIQIITFVILLALGIAAPIVKHLTDQNGG